MLGLLGSFVRSAGSPDEIESIDYNAVMECVRNTASCSAHDVVFIWCWEEPEQIGSLLKPSLSSSSRVDSERSFLAVMETARVEKHPVL